jgi:predicted DNA-binding antitoxin AbrB/MazE fold protein
MPLHMGPRMVECDECGKMKPKRDVAFKDGGKRAVCLACEDTKRIPVKDRRAMQREYEKRKAVEDRMSAQHHRAVAESRASSMRPSQQHIIPNQEMPESGYERIKRRELRRVRGHE